MKLVLIFLLAILIKLRETVGNGEAEELPGCEDYGQRCAYQIAKVQGICTNNVKFGALDCCLSCAIKMTGKAAAVAKADWLAKLKTKFSYNKECKDQKMPNGTSYTPWCAKLQKNPTPALKCAIPISVRYLCAQTCSFCTIPAAPPTCDGKSDTPTCSNKNTARCGADGKFNCANDGRKATCNGKDKKTLTCPPLPTCNGTSDKATCAKGTAKCGIDDSAANCDDEGPTEPSCGADNSTLTCPPPPTCDGSAVTAKCSNNKPPMCGADDKTPNCKGEGNEAPSCGGPDKKVMSCPPLPTCDNADTATCNNGKPPRCGADDLTPNCKGEGNTPPSCGTDKKTLTCPPPPTCDNTTTNPPTCSNGNTAVCAADKTPNCKNDGSTPPTCAVGQKDPTCT